MGLRNLFGTLAVVALTAGLALADDWNKTYQISARPDLRVETDDGSVTVRGWDQKTIEARITTKGWKIGEGEVRVYEHQTGDSVTLEVKSPRMRWSTGDRWIRVELSVPKEAAVNIRTGDGAVHVTDLHGSIRMNTGDGGIDAESVAGTLEARTGDGHIRVRGRFDVLALNTGDGGIEADVDPGSKIESPWRVETGDGGVTVRVPQDLNADFEAHTGDGGISVDVPFTVSAGKVDEHHVRGRLNAGGQPFTVRTGDGGIHIARR